MAAGLHRALRLHRHRYRFKPPARQQQRWRLDVGEIGAAHAEAVLQARPHRGDARTFAEEEAEQDVHLAQWFEETAVA